MYVSFDGRPLSASGGIEICPTEPGWWLDRTIYTVDGVVVDQAGKTFTLLLAVSGCDQEGSQPWGSNTTTIRLTLPPHTQSDSGRATDY